MDPDPHKTILYIYGKHCTFRSELLVVYGTIILGLVGQEKTFFYIGTILFCVAHPIIVPYTCMSLIKLI